MCERLRDDDRLKKARIHPFSILLALKTYQTGKGDKGKLTWAPEQTVLNALDDAFYKAFKVCDDCLILLWCWQALLRHVS